MVGDARYFADVFVAWPLMWRRTVGSTLKLGWGSSGSQVSWLPAGLLIMTVPEKLRLVKNIGETNVYPKSLPVMRTRLWVAVIYQKERTEHLLKENNGITQCIAVTVTTLKLIIFLYRHNLNSCINVIPMQLAKNQCNLPNGCGVFWFY